MKLADLLKEIEERKQKISKQFPHISQINSRFYEDVFAINREIFQFEFLEKYSDIDISRVIIEEPLVRSNNVNTVATLLRFNGMICRSVYEVLNLVPEFISSYDARKFAFPELMDIRKLNKKGEPYSEKELERKQPVLFGGHPYDVDKKQVIWEKVNEREPQIVWVYDKHQRLSKENFDMTDAYACVLGQMRKENKWK